MISYPIIAVKAQMKHSPKIWNKSPRNPVTEKRKGFLTIKLKTSQAEAQKFLDVMPIYNKNWESFLIRALT